MTVANDVPNDMWRNAGSFEEYENEARAILDRVGLAGDANVVAATLSHGEKRKLEVAIALAGLLPYLRAHLSASVLTTDIGGVTVGTAYETFLNGHASLYLGVLFVLFVLFVPNGLLGTLREYLGGTVAAWVARRIERR